MPKENKTIYPILGLLAHEDLTGYDIKKKIDYSLSFFWDIGFGQIYPCLKSLEQDGLVTKRSEDNEKRPGRIVYSLTDKGRTVLKAWLRMPAEKEYVKYEILAKLFFGSLLTKDENIKNIEDFRKRNEEYLHTMEHFKDVLNGVLNENKDHPYYLLTVLFGEKLYKAYLEWSEEAICLLNKVEAQEQG